jgi:hypothetical protein
VNADKSVIQSGLHPACRNTIVNAYPKIKWRGESHALVHIPKFRNGAGKILANASTPDFSGASDKILGYALKAAHCFSLRFFRKFGICTKARAWAVSNRLRFETARRH